MDIEEISTQNPWWKERANINKDILVKTWINSKIKWEPRSKFTYKLDKDVIYTIRGPRQVGKTTHIKLWIRTLLFNGVNNKDILYYSCDIVPGPKELIEIITTYLRWREERKDRKYIFLDEISSIKNWQKGIKLLVDSNQLVNCTIILTGSHALDIKKSAELLPGRLGKEDVINDRLFLPMKFSEFVDTVSIKNDLLVICQSG